MAGVERLIAGLRSEAQRLETQLAGIKAAISSLVSVALGTGGRKRGRPAGSENAGAKQGIIIVGGRTRRKMSAKARKAISMAQKARWAKQKAGEKIK
jgi:hypothetical protein